MIRPDPSATDRLDKELHYLPARMINEFVYCPRLFYLEHVDGLFSHNADTVEGVAKHVRVDRKTDALPGRTEVQERELIHARSVSLASEEHGVIAKLDLIEANGGVATPVDYKRGSPKCMEDGTLGAWDPERVQMCIQAMVLRENGYQCEEAILFFWETRQRVRIAIDDALLQQTEEAIRDARLLMDSAALPPPLVDSPKCPRCSLVSICLPDETARCRIGSNDNASEGGKSGPWIQPLLFDIGPQFLTKSMVDEKLEPKPIRQLVTPREDRKSLYLNTQGLFVGVSNQVLQIKEKSTTIQEVRLKDLSQVNLFGSIQVSTQAVQALLGAEIPLLYFSFGGWFHGMTQSVGLKNIAWRREQFRMADRPEFCLRLARQLVSGKIRNQRTMLMRNHIEPSADWLRFLKEMQWEAERAESMNELLGIEGMAARIYFQNFSGMLKVGNNDEALHANGSSQGCGLNGVGMVESKSTGSEGRFPFYFEKRNRRPPRDPVNALLSLGYSLLAKDLTIVAASVGLDPYLGFYHQLRFGRASLALDLMEPFRPLVVDSAVLSAINQRMVTERDFVAAGDSVALKPEGRKGFFQAYEQRMDQLVTHPLFGYRVSYRRMLEIQTRLLARVFLGELRDYPVFVTR